MTINLQKPDITELKPRITVFGVGGGGGNAVNNMITGGLDGVEFVVANTDAQALSMNKAERIIQLGTVVTEGLGAGSMPDIGRAAAEECIDEINDHLNGTHMCFVTAGMGGGTGTGAAPVVARAARERGILTVGVVTKPFHFEGQRRMKTADAGIEELQASVDTLIVIPNQNLFRIANDKTTFADAFGMADQVLYSGVACITDLMVKEGLINLDFADVRSVMRDMGKAMMGTGEASGEGRAMTAAEAAIANPLLDETSMKGARGLLISITGGRDMTLFEVDEAATRIREEVDQDANIILGATFDESLEGIIRVSVVATGIESMEAAGSVDNRTPSRAVTGAAPVQSMPRPQLSVQPQAKPVEAAKPAPAKPALDPVAEAQKEMEALSNARKVEETKQEESFVPQSRLFTAPQAKPAPSVATAQPVREPAAEVKPQPTVVPMPTATQSAQFTEPRMPQVEDFPPMVQAELETKTARTAPRVAEDDDRGPLGLLKRLTNGLSRREEHEAPAEPRLRPMSPASEQRSEETRRPLSQEASMYAPARSQHDNQGRTQPAAVNQDDDQLEIPAFLRRQAN
ncbi:cell division protein FtsZ [Ahrensia sp. 13_GOM-1096m]|uniref:cell division protein FtsZ n=1 Tax=Ahrensia sp. 13_GOM-1096m TaxID=1380380 RepID=UPI00047C809B|nr:cell division protein FtsZ [Ahrensia sp. 13_GOM-1096m]